MLPSDENDFGENMNDDDGEETTVGGEADEAEMIAFGEKIGRSVKPHMVITMTGELGAGKTTLTKGIGKGLGITKIINSPITNI